MLDFDHNLGMPGYSTAKVNKRVDLSIIMARCRISQLLCIVSVYFSNAVSPTAALPQLSPFLPNLMVTRDTMPA